MLTTQRSIPIPPVKIERILAYLKHICEKGEATPDELKKLGLDFGRGVGDITRFLRNIRVITVSQGKVKICEEDSEKICKSINNMSAFRKVMHQILYERLVQYKIACDIIRELGKVNIDELYQELNNRISEISPSSWVNKVAFRTIITFLTDLGIAKKSGNTIEYYAKAKVEEATTCIRSKISKVGTRHYLTVNDIAACTGSDEKTIVTKLSEAKYVRFVKSPSAIALVEVKDLEKGIKEILSLLLNE